jgi:hypothetical protein
LKEPLLIILHVSALSLLHMLLNDPQQEADDEEGRQESGGVYVGEDLPKKHHEKLTDARKHIKEM